MSREEMMLESIRNYFHVKKGLFSLDIVLAEKNRKIYLEWIRVSEMASFFDDFCWNVDEGDV